MKPLRVLHVEDQVQDTALLDRELRRGGYEVQSTRVDTEAGLRSALRKGSWDLILADYQMPHFSGPAALEVLKDEGLDVPFIIVSGSVDESIAVESMRRGARDYISKQNLARLNVAVERELQEAQTRARLRHDQSVQSILPTASEKLAETLDFDATLQTVAALVVPRLADWCGIYLAQPDGKVVLEAVVHLEPARVAVLRQYFAEYPIRATAERGIGAVVRSGKPDFLPELSEEQFAQAFPDARARELIRQLHVGDVANFPLTRRGRVFGVLSLAMERGQRRLGLVEKQVGEELALRASTALENALLYRESQEAVRVREDFLSVASHELRTPLQTINFQLELLEARLTQRAPSEELHGAVARCKRQSKRLATLVDELLDVSRLSAGAFRVERQPVDLASIAREVTSQLDGLSQGSRLRVHVEEGARVQGNWDPQRLEQVFVNIVSNALKFGGGNPVEVRMGTRDGDAWVRVEDRGIGIPEGELKRIFERFARAASPRSYGGLGLGLYIAREIVAAHGGRIWAERNPGGGAAIAFTLPLEAEPLAP